ncbi:biopolymer transporter ExbD [Flavobacteriaceae bacterium XHP0103]|uniref:ExbD/TolR family protein n=1 Tax=Marixanthotalea marina TaxID=2844359 RepID=UPI002989CD71|nr:biopolymer transporter ExbD [Marixanthotalea marina]MBU3820873.1 biopolymer transporter ExbD [Marixanthotalea marina]
MAKRAAPEVNAGSMADIAFLLLIFFLVTTTIPKDSGISRKLPPIDNSDQEPPILREKNIFKVIINRRDQLLVEDEIKDIKDLRQAAVEFLDNNGDGSCEFCQGKRDPASSDNPIKAVISLENNRETTYAAYIAVQNELVAAYNELRNRRALEIGPQRGFPNMNFVEMQEASNNVQWVGDKDKLKEVIEQIQEEIPQKLAEVAGTN